VLQEREQQRLSQTELFWKMYNGQQWDYRREEGEMPYFNLCYTFVEKSISWLMGVAPEPRSTKKLQPILKHLYRELVENSGGDQFYYEVAQVGAVTGDVIIRVGYDATVNNGAGGVCFKVMDSARTFWEYSNQGQNKKLTRVMTIWDELLPSGELQTIAELWTDTEVRYYGYVSEISADTIVSPMAGRLFNDGEDWRKSIQRDSHGAAIVRPNPYGELPFVHIKNIEVSQDSHGRSDLHDLWILNKELNAALLQYKDNVDYHGNPLTLVYGISLKNIEKGANKIWANLPKDGKVENLEVTQTFAMVQEYIKYMKEFAGISSFIPEASLGLQQAVSNTSATAIQLQYLPLTELTRRKKLTYGRGLKEAFEKGLRFMNQIGGFELERLDGIDEDLLKTQRYVQTQLDVLAATPEDGALLEGDDPSNPTDIAVEMKQEQNNIFTPEDYTVMLDVLGRISGVRQRPFYTTDLWFKDPIPRDEVNALSLAQTKLGMNLTSRTKILEDLGDEDAFSTIAEVDEERLQTALVDGEVATRAQAQVPQPPVGQPGAEEPPPETPADVETRTGQPAQNVAEKRALKGKP
jgi:hypothetical protein